ncbi:hypothetical protein [Brevundimonas sp. AAP58]|uniref:hypothetical protein n=1 Tax=Brevundimonas sp. AAP58 TaxID=1523422 RepID=UPI0012E0EC0E|nr:hypothetical protein [Brevundimonas sp. AAP58]
MVGYSDQLPGVEPVFRPGDLLFVLEAHPEGELRCAKLTFGGRIVPHQTDLVWREEFLPLSEAPKLLPRGRAGRPIRIPRQPQRARVTWSELEAIFLAPKSKEFTDLRDRAAHLHLTGGYATHLQQFFVGALCLISSTRDGRTLIDPQTGAIQVAEEVVQRLALDEHLMVKAVRKMQAEGWRIRQSLGPNKRRPYTKVFMCRGEARITVQLDGSMLDHWPYSGRSR